MIEAAAIVLAGLFVAAAVWRGRGLERHVKRRVVIHTTDDQSLRGVLRASYRDSIELASVEYLDRAREEPRQLPGSALVLRSKVAWLQVLED